MLKQKYFLTGIFILSAERQPIKLAWRKIVWLLFEKRFFNIYKKYVVYEGYLCRNLVCYFVVRVAHYKGFDVVSLVDFRYRKEDYVNSIHKAVSEIAKMNRIGFYLTLSSLKRKVLDFFPIILRTSKKLYGGTTIPHINKECSLLITSADSDLDFVYYL